MEDRDDIDSNGDSITASSEQPLLPHRYQYEHSDSQRRRPSWSLSRRTKIALAVLTTVLIFTHVLFVVLLRTTTASLESMTIPDLCHKQSVGDVILQLHNPSYCRPDVGQLHASIYKQDQLVLNLTTPAFNLQRGHSTLVTDVHMDILPTPHELYDILFHTPGEFYAKGQIPVTIHCLLVPFTVHLDVSSIFHTASTIVDDRAQERWLFSADPLLDQRLQLSSEASSITNELKRVVQQVLSSIALSHFRVVDEADAIFAYSDVRFQYDSSVLWNVPPLTLRINSNESQTILSAGLSRFLLGAGDTFIMADSVIHKKEMQPLRSMIEHILMSKGETLHVSGDNGRSDCYSLQVLDLIDFDVNVPSTVDGKPLLLRHYSAKPTIKKLDSHTEQCLIKLDVVLGINNPLPVNFHLFDIDFDLYYLKSGRKKKHYLVHVDDENQVVWTPHTENNVTIETELHYYRTCKDVISLYFKDELSFAIEDGSVHLGVGSGNNFTIPFSIPEIRIHPEVAHAQELV